MTLELAKDVEEFLQAQVESGTCEKPADLVNHVLRDLRNRQRQSLQTSAELEKWLLESADSPVSSLDSKDFAEIRHRVRQRRQDAAS